MSLATRIEKLEHTTRPGTKTYLMENTGSGYKIKVDDKEKLMSYKEVGELKENSNDIFITLPSLEWAK